MSKINTYINHNKTQRAEKFINLFLLLWFLWVPGSQLCLAERTNRRIPVNLLVTAQTRLHWRGCCWYLNGGGLASAQYSRGSEPGLGVPATRRAGTAGPPRRTDVLLGRERERAGRLSFRVRAWAWPGVGQGLVFLGCRRPRGGPSRHGRSGISVEVGGRSVHMRLTSWDSGTYSDSKRRPLSGAPSLDSSACLMMVSMALMSACICLNFLHVGHLLLLQ